MTAPAPDPAASAASGDWGDPAADLAAAFARTAPPAAPFVPAAVTPAAPPPSPSRFRRSVVMKLST